MRPVLERQDNPWEEVLLLNPSRKRGKGGRKVAKKRSRKGRRHSRKGRRVTIPVTVQGGGLLATGRRRRIKGIKVMGRNAFGRFKRSRKGGRRRGGRKGRRAGGRRAHRRAKRGVSGLAWQRAHRKTLRKRASRLGRAGKLKSVSNKPSGFEYLDNPRGGRRMARRRRRGRRRSRRHSAVAPVRRHRKRGRRRGRRSHRRGVRRHRSRRRSHRRSRRSYRRDNPRKKGARRRHGRRRHSFSLLAIRRSNPLSAIKSFPFKEAAVNGAIAGAALLGTRYLLGSKSPLPTSVLSFVGTPGTVQNVAVKNGVLFGIGLLTYSFTKFKPAGLAMATVAVANAVSEIGAQQLGSALGDLGLTYGTFEALPTGSVSQPTGLFNGLSSDLIYGSAQPYGLAGGMGDSNFVVDSAMPYGSGMEGLAESDEVYA